MPVEVILPKVDMDMATGRISKWFVAEGDAVKKGDVLFEIETDKAAMEIDAPASGVLRDVDGSEGEDIAVGAAVAWIYEEGEAFEEKSSSAQREEDDGAQSPPSDEPVAADVDSGTADAGAAAPAALADETQPGVGAKGRATPLARRLAREAKIELSRIDGSGPRGRIVRADVETYLARRESGASPDGSEIRSEPAAVQQQGAAPDTALDLFSEGSYELVPHTAMRRTIARRLAAAKSSVPHFYLTVDCRLDALLALRTELNSMSGRNGAEYKLSVNDMVIKAYALALQAVPEANATWSEDAMVRHRHADIGVAVSIPGGLITPIVRMADTKSLSTISREMKDLGARAREGRLKPEQYQGGTAAVSNLGMFGVKAFSAIINSPHATILAVGAGERRPVVTPDDEIAVGTVMSATLSTDHRAVDGALAAELLGVFRALVEEPMGMLV